MGYFGRSGFENDNALDWLAEVREKPSVTRLTKAFGAYAEHIRKPPRPQKFSRDEIEDNIQAVLSFNREDPPEWWAKSGKSKATLLKQLEKELRDKYDSGRYLDEQYGPVEPALAAAELVAAWGCVGPEKLPRAAAEAVKRFSGKALPQRLVDDALVTVESALSDKRYARMRKFYLDAFPETSGGFDQMEGVRDLLRRLRLLMQEDRVSSTPKPGRNKPRSARNLKGRAS